jgi:hypothetical protein
MAADGACSKISVTGEGSSEAMIGYAAKTRIRLCCLF